MKYKYTLIFLYLFIIFFKKTNSLSTLKIKFKKYISPSLPKDNYILSNYNNNIYISFKIGNPHQNTEKIFLKSDTYEFMIANKTLDKNNFNYTESQTCKISTFPRYYQLKYTYKAQVLKDHFYLDNTEKNNKLIELQNITFLYASKITYKQYTAVLGLKLDEEGVMKVKTFPEQLTELKYLKDSNWMIKYTSEDNGYFYIGEILNNEIFLKYNKEEFRKTNAIISGRYLSWDLIFSQIESNGIKLNGPMQANLDFNFGLISVSSEYYNSIKNNFFKEYIDKGECQELIYNYTSEENIEDIKSIFKYIVCKKNFKMKKFPEISFYHTELDFVFELNYEDVFSKYNGKIYFLCINEVNNNENWVFGKPFFKKYNIIFDQSAKTIGFYGKTKYKMNWIVIEWIIVVMLFFIFIILAYTLFRRYRLNHYKSFEKKIKVDELNDSFNGDYQKQINFNEIKEENKIIDDK